MTPYIFFEIFHYNLPRITDTLYEDQHIFLITSHSILLRIRNVSDKSFYVNNLFLKIVRL